jgi:hypothetical protein
MAQFTNSYQGLHDYIKDICTNLSADVTFFHGRKEVLYEYNPDPNEPVVWLLPLQSSGSLTSNAYQVNRAFTVNLIFYRHDAPGSEIDQNSQDTIASEMSVLSQSDQLAEEFLRLFNQNSITDDLQDASEELEVQSFSTDNVIKDNQYFLTGTLLNMTVQVPDEFNYCATARLESVSYTNNFQDVTSAFADMTPTLLPTVATATYSAASLPAGLTIDSGTGVISQSDYASIPFGINVFTVSIVGTGDYAGSSLSFQVVFCKRTASQPILRTVLWMNQNTYDGLGAYDADTQYIIDDDLANGVTETIYTAWPT